MEIKDENLELMLGEDVLTFVIKCRHEWEYPTSNIASCGKLWMAASSIIVDDFLLSAGGILINEKKKEVCLIKNTKEYLLPKGRKELDESIAETAQREIFEETGYKNCVDPDKLLGIYFRQHIGGTPGMHKVIYWFYSKLTSDTRIEGTQEEHEDFSVEWHDLDSALKNLSFADDKILIQRAFAHLSENSSKILESIPQNDLVYCGPENKCIRFLTNVNTKFVKGFIAFDESQQKIILLMDRIDNTWKLPSENDKKLPTLLTSKLTENSSATFFQLIFDIDLTVMEWHVLTISEGATGDLEFFDKKKALVLLKNDKNSVDLVETAFKLK